MKPFFGNGNSNVVKPGGIPIRGANGKNGQGSEPPRENDDSKEKNASKEELLFLDPKKRILSLLKSFVAWFFWEFLPVRLILYKINPNWSFLKSKEERPFSTFFLWFLGIYIVMFGIATVRYKNRVEVLEAKTNAISVQVAITEVRKRALSKLPLIQKLKCPEKPLFSSPTTVFRSLVLGSEVNYSEVSILEKNLIEEWKTSLQGASLISVDLKNAFLIEANLKGATLEKSNLQGAYLDRAKLNGAYLLEVNLRNAYMVKADLTGAFLEKANLQEVNLKGANLTNAYFKEANLRDAHLVEANLSGAILKGADISGVSLEKANLKGVKELTLKQLETVSSLYMAKGVPARFKKRLEKMRPELFKKPSYYYE
ncbi:MAG: pentapeptide repeat-containing protein [bacterium]|nr:pentapeptide repeat-containing protein [bacterium]